jgi:HK97 family phage major capsid protein
VRLIDKLRQARAAALDKMENLNTNAERDNRPFTDAEVVAWDTLKGEVAVVDAQLANAEERAALLKGDTTARAITPGAPRLIDQDGNVIRALTKADRLSDALPRRSGADEGPPSVSRVLRGIVLGNWDRATRVERAMGEATLAGGGYAVPAELSATWLDAARSASVCMAAGAITIPMTSSTMRIVRVDGDLAVNFRDEHAPIPESDLVFGAVDLKARTAGILCRVSVELLEDSPIANAAIEQSMSAAMGLAFDRAMLAGDGNTAGAVDNPTGLLYAAGVNEIAAVGLPANYNAFINAYTMVMSNNGLPNAWVMSELTANVLWQTPTGLTGDKNQLGVPVPLDTLPRFVTTSLRDQKVVGQQSAIVGDFSALGLAMRTGLTLEASRTAADTMSKVEVLIRLYARIDVAVLRPKFFTRLIGMLPSTTMAAAAVPPNPRPATA